ncbi:hypothetical protein QOZ80_6BG0472130 [Eleusine coracana subsp. coracana]|nr:hypothetical protein QOZ80_6BG0472130 [Eleusine coracana subsp. coracana]
MASQVTKMFAMLSLLALCVSAATAALVPSYFSPIMGTGAMEPCMQYCMMQQAFGMGGITSPMTMSMLQHPWVLPLMQQCGMQTMVPSMMTTLPQCNCGAIWQQQLPLMFGAMTPSAFINQPCVGGACFQQPFVSGSLFPQPFLGYAF